MAATIWSDSSCFTRGSFAPWAISIGIRIASTRESGERDHRKSASVSGLPTRLWNWATSGAQYGGMLRISVRRSDGPTTSIAQVKASGENVAPTSAA